jgi:multidrug resistance efflux pump
MAIKFRKLHETATLEAGATIPRVFNYKSAFIIFLVCLVGLAVLAYAAVYFFTMNRLSTTSAEAVPSAEHEVRATVLSRIKEMRVHYGDAVKQGDVLCVMAPLKDTADMAFIAEKRANLAFEGKMLDLLKGGSKTGMVILNDVQRRYDEADGALKMAQASLEAEKKNLESVTGAVNATNSGRESDLRDAELRLAQAEEALKVANAKFDKAQEYFNDRIITVDKRDAAEQDFKRRQLDRDASAQIADEVRKVRDAIAAEGVSRIAAQEQAVAKEQANVAVAQSVYDKVKAERDNLNLNSASSAGAGPKPEAGNQGAAGDEVEAQRQRVARAQAELDGVLWEKSIDLELLDKDGLQEIKAPCDGKVGWIQAREGDTLAPDDFIMTVFSSKGMEIQARFPQDAAGNIAPKQAVDVKVRTDKGYRIIRGTVVAITNQLYTLPPQVRERMRIENPHIETNLVVVRISLEGVEKEMLFPGDPVTVTIYTNK